MKKVLIVEDEILARLGLRQLVDWKKTGTGAVAGCNRWRRGTGNDPEQLSGYHSSRFEHTQS